MVPGCTSKVRQAVGLMPVQRCLALCGAMALALMVMPVHSQPVARSAGAQPHGSASNSHAVLRTVSAVELTRFYVRLKPLPGASEITRSDALRTVRELFPGRRVLEAVPALVSTSTSRAWAADWVVSLKPYPQLQSVPASPGHPKLNEPKNRKPFLIIFVSAQTGRYDGEVFQFWRGHFWRSPCTYIPFNPTAYVLTQGRWHPAPTVKDSGTGEKDPILHPGQMVRLSITVRPSVCQDRFSRVRLHFRRAYTSANGVTQYRNWVGPRAWLRGVRAKGSWRFVWQSRFELHLPSHLVLAGWDVTTASAEIGPNMLIHARQAGPKMVRSHRAAVTGNGVVPPYVGQMAQKFATEMGDPSPASVQAVLTTRGAAEKLDGAIVDEPQTPVWFVEMAGSFVDKDAFIGPGAQFPKGTSVDFTIDTKTRESLDLGVSARPPA